MNRDDLQRLVASGESETVEFKRTTGQLRRAGETLCGFLNARGGVVLIGVNDRGEIVGQDVSDATLREVAAMLDRFEPPVITAAEPSGPHRSIRRNPLIAEAFHRTGAVEIRGRGTNRVIEACERHGIEAPIFEEQSGALHVTFRAQIGPTASRDVSAAVAAPGTRAERILAILRDRGPLGSAAILEALGEGITKRMLQKELGRLKAAGQVTVVGRARATTYSASDQEG